MTRLHYDAAPTWPYTFAKTASTIALIVGIVSLLGWIFYLWIPPEFHKALLIVKPNTAICLIMIGTALWIRCDHNKYNNFHMAELTSSAVFLIGFLTLFQYLFNIDLGIDEGLFKIPLHHVTDFLPPGRMSPYTAISFITLGFILFFLDSKVIRYQVHQLLLSLLFIFTYFELLTSLYNQNAAIHYALSATPVIITFLALTLGVLFVRPFKGIAATLTSGTNGGMLARRIIPPILILPILLGYAELTGRQAGYFGAGSGIALLIMSIVILFTILIMIYAHIVNKVDIYRQQAEFALKRSQLQLQAILDQANAIISIYDLEGRLSLVNKQFERTFHKTSAEVLGKKVKDVLPEKLAEKIIKIHSDVIQSRYPVSVEEIISNGSEDRIYLSNKFPIFDAQGALTAVCNIATDVTEINKMHEEISEREERLSLALKSADAGTWIWDIPNDIVVWDEHLFKLFGLKSGNMTGRYTTLLNFIHPDDRKNTDDSIQKILVNGTEYKSEFRIIKPDGTISYLATRGQVHRDAQGKPLRIAGVSWDITERKQHEVELRTAILNAQHLAEEAKAASHAKSAFLATMSHEIRTPLSGIIGMTELLLDTPLAIDQHKSVETIKSSGEALLSVINNILDFSKIESDRMELDIVRFDLHALVEDTVELLAIEAHRKGIAIGAFIDPSVPEWVSGDPAKLRQILFNLLSNAEKFTDSGEISVNITKIPCKSSQKDCVCLQFEIIDTGIGISDDVKEKLFKPFSQGDVSTSRKYGGTGLGLVISKRLVEMMGGSIIVDSRPQYGSRFIFTVNLSQCQSRAPSIHLQTIPELDTLRIICIDDNKIIRDIIRQQTTVWNVHCDTASNAMEALSMIRSAYDAGSPYALALIDYIMPGMAASELVQSILQLSEAKGIKIIALVPLGLNINPTELKQLGVNHTLTKPFRASRLREILLHALKDQIGHHGSSQKSAKPNEDKKIGKILVAEDNPINSEMAIRILDKLGYQADAVKNGIQALKALQTQSYDLVLMDCQMPELDGYSTAMEIRSKEVGSKNHMPIIAMTAHALKGDREKCIAAGMDDYIAKPISIKSLKTKIERWIEGAGFYESDYKHHDSTSLIDMDRLNSIFGNDTKGIDKFLDVLIETLADTLDKIHVAIEANNEKATRQLFHQLKGCASNAGIRQIAKLCVMAEDMLSLGEWEKINEYFNAILALTERLKIEVDSKHHQKNR